MYWIELRFIGSTLLAASTALLGCKGSSANAENVTPSGSEGAEAQMSHSH